MNESVEQSSLIRCEKDGCTKRAQEGQKYCSWQHSPLGHLGRKPPRELTRYAESRSPYKRMHPGIDLEDAKQRRTRLFKELVERRQQVKELNQTVEKLTVALEKVAKQAAKEKVKTMERVTLVKDRIAKALGRLP